MLDRRKFYINGTWCAPNQAKDSDVINPATQQAVAKISLGSPADVDKAVMAAKAAFPTWSTTKPKERLAYVEAILAQYKAHSQDMAEAISMEMGAPIDLAVSKQVAAGTHHIETFIKSFKAFDLQSPLVNGEGSLAYDAIGVVGLITPWNWPMNQITLKVIPALLAGCTMILKPSEIAPLSAMLFGEIIDKCNLPKGVFNLVNGEGGVVGDRISHHPDIAMISFTGSTRAGIEISKAAAQTLKRVELELGGKGANVIFADARAEAVAHGVEFCFQNSGQSCNAPTRMLVERSYYDQALEIAKKTAQKIKVGNPKDKGEHIGPVVSQQQYEKIQKLIKSGIDEGAKLLVGGLGKPEGFEKGSYVKPTIFADVSEDMTIFKEEIFGPVLIILPFDNKEEAIRIANNTIYGLTNYVESGDEAKAKEVALKLRSGMVEVNGQALPAGSFFGGVKYSGRAREGGKWGIEEFLDSKAISI